VRDADVSFWYCFPTTRLERSRSVLVNTSHVNISKHQASEDVLCVAAWKPQFADNTHVCLVVEIDHPIDPVPASSIFDADTYTQIGQRNLVLNKLATVNFRWQRSFRVPFHPGGGTTVRTRVITERPTNYDDILRVIGLPKDTSFSSEAK